MNDEQHDKPAIVGDLAPFRRFLGLGPETAGIAIRLGAVLRPHIPEVVESFYARMRTIPEAMAIFRGGEAQIQRQRGFLSKWLEELLTGPYDDAYIDRRRRVGIVHLNAGVDEQLMIAAVNWLRSDLHKIVGRVDLPEGMDHHLAQEALSRLLDFDLGIILNSYYLDLHARSARLDRLALIGQFSAAINHELRNPLGVIGTSLFLLRRHAKGIASDEINRQLDKIGRSLDRANSIITGMLDLLRVKPPTRDTVDVARLIDDIVGELAVPEGIVLEIHGDPLGATGRFDATQLRQVVENLLRNAIEAIDGRPGHITLRWSADALSTVIRVEDDGPGVPEEMRRRVFEPLHSTKAFGTGLGLTLAKTIIESHGGTLTLGPGIGGKGAGFEIRLPHFLVPRPTPTLG